jgi:hypothetical protein
MTSLRNYIFGKQMAFSEMFTEMKIVEGYNELLVVAAVYFNDCNFLFIYVTGFQSGLDLSTHYTHHSELQAITALPLISILYISL